MPVKRFSKEVTAERIRALTPAPPTAAVAEVLQTVEARGDLAVLEFEHRFSGAPAPNADAHIEPVAPDRLRAALEGLGPHLRESLELAVENVRLVAEASLGEDVSVTLPQGQTVEYRSLPVGRAGAYVPGGRGSYPSTAIMCLTTAKVAGVPSICVVSPPREDGEIDASVAAVCALLDVDEVFAIGGAQAIAALGLGTESIRPVDVIVGPGNAYVQEAKRQLVGRVGIDGIAGPSELVVVADASADPEAISLDLLAQAEHGPDSLVALFSPDNELLDAVAERASDIPAEMALVCTQDMSAAIALADTLAPEHLQIVAAEPEAKRLAESVNRAGAVFIGPNAATAFGDYVAGSNHVLPTGGAARYAEALSVATFRRRMGRIFIPDEAVPALAGAGAAIAHAEGFPLHGRSMEVRQK